MVNYGQEIYASLSRVIDGAFDEDIASGDVTTNAVVDSGTRASAVWVAKQNGIIAGLDVARLVFERLDENLQWTPHVKEGDEVRAGDVLVIFEGNCRALLTGERTALNLAQRMSGIATKTCGMVKQLNGFATKILDTRKTVPGLRLLDKYAVKTGGGSNHRIGLFDLAMIKDNHIKAAGSISEAVSRVRKADTAIKIEVEITTLPQVEEALKAGVDMIMLDNMNTETMRQAVKIIDGKAETEASGNMTADRLREVAATGVDYISVGALTHSVEAFDISQQIKNIFEQSHKNHQL